MPRQTKVMMSCSAIRTEFHSITEQGIITMKKTQDFLNDPEKFTNKTKEKSKDEYWQIADAYLKF